MIQGNIGINTTNRVLKSCTFFLRKMQGIIGNKMAIASDDEVGFQLFEQKNTPKTPLFAINDDNVNAEIRIYV